MTDKTEIQDNPLAAAEAQLRDICERHEEFAAPIDTGSLGRMMVHIRNINRSVSESSRDYRNAAKRLTDFGVTLSRLATHSAAASEDLATRFRTLADMLKSTGAELGDESVTPRWVQAPGA
jgi:hypothetical protein